MAQINNKSKKEEILEAYEKLLLKYESEKSQLIFGEPEKPELPNIPVNKKSIFNEIESLKLSFVKELEFVGEKIKVKIDEIEELEKTIKQEKDYLENVLNIKAQAESLYAIADMQTAKEQELQDNIESKKRELKKIEDDWKYSFEQIKQKETYDWDLKRDEMKRKFDADIQKKMTELVIKEENLDSRLDEFENSKKEVVRLQQELAHIGEKLQTEIREKLTLDFEFEKRMLLKDFEMKEKVLELENSNLQSKIDDLIKTNGQLQKLLENATQRIETLASKVVESNRPLIYDKGEK